MSDRILQIASSNVFGRLEPGIRGLPWAYKTPISSTKSMIGHTLGAAGALEAVACVKTILTGQIHPTINYENPDPKCDLDYVANEARHQQVDTALSNSFGFGGQNACVVFRRFEG